MMTDEEFKVMFANNLRKCIKRKGITQKELANAIGVSEGNLSDWLNLKSQPRMNKVDKMAAYLGVTRGMLMGADESDRFYKDESVQQMAQELFENPEARTLFRAAKNLSKEDMETVSALIKSLTKGKSND